MSVDLYEHQKKAVEQLKNGAVLCGGVGTGKSRTALAYYYTKVCNGKLPKSGKQNYIPMQSPKDLYIITTARKRDTLEWENELAPFLLSTNIDISPVKVVVDSWNNIKKYIDVKDSFFIFDEQRLVGSGAWVKAFLKIAKSNGWILLSATPGDTWIDYCPVFIANGYFKNRTQFVREHVVFSRYSKYPKIDRYVGIPKLKQLLSSILVTMEYQKEATQHHQWEEVGYDVDAYNMVMKNRFDIFNNKPIKNIPELCYLLRKIVNSSPQRLMCVSRLIDLNPKTIIFYNFDYELDLLKDLCIKKEISFGEWNGHKHETIPKTSKWVYLVQYTAGAEGWNCIETNTIIFYSQNYSYRITVQASGRIDRLNTEFKDLYYYHIFTDSSIDKAIKRCLKKKKDFNDKTFVTGIELEPSINRDFCEDDPFEKTYAQLRLDI